jgi:RNA polymerase sigma-70 factor (ECF subfamily)
VLEALATQEMSAAGAEPADLEDARLVRALRHGDGAAFETLYQRRRRRVYGLAYHLSGRAGEAEELVQEVFVRAWEHRGDFQSGEHLDRWLRRVAVNTWINQLRRGRETSLEELTADGPPLAGEHLPPAPVGTRLDLQRALAALPPSLRAVVVLFDVYGLRHDEISALLEITTGSSKVQLHRARQRLKEWLQ